MKLMETNNLFLACDRAGNPNAWLNYEMAVHLIATNRVLAPLGEHARMIFGGVNAISGRRSSIELCSILLTNARVREHRWARDYEAPLTNRALFARDGYLCLYCGQGNGASALTRDHIVPVSRGGKNRWTNVATACRSCNQRKNNRTPEEWGQLLLAVPFAPNWAEFLYLKNNRRMVVDQMDFLKARFSHNSPLLH